MKKLTMGLLIASALIATGCGSRGSSKSGSRMKRPNPANAAEITAVEDNKDCPTNIEGKYEGQMDSGKKLLLEISRNADAQLQVSMTVEGGTPVVQVVDGEEHTASDGSTVKMSCEDHSITSLGTINGVEYKGTYTTSETGVTIEQTSPESSSREFRKLQ